MACCEKPLTGDDLQETLNDPALADCCRRDLEQQARATRLTSLLRQLDRTTERLKLERGVLASDRAPADPYADVCCAHSGADDCCQRSELQHLRTSRLRELRAAAARQRDAAALQYGVLHQVPHDDALAMVQLAKLCVCHLQDSLAQTAHEVDQLLQSLARSHCQTLFLRAPYERCSPLAQHCRMPGPGLVCLRGGVPISAGPREAFTSDSGRLEDAALVGWLTQAGVLAAGESADTALARPTLQDSEDSDADDWETRCTTCGRCYPHEHVQPSRGAAASDEDSDF